MIESRNTYFFYKTSPEGGRIEDEVFVIRKVTLLSRTFEENLLEGKFTRQEKEDLEALARRFPWGRELYIPKRKRHGR